MDETESTHFHKEWFLMSGQIVSEVHFGYFGNGMNTRLFFKNGGFLDLLSHNQEGLKHLDENKRNFPLGDIAAMAVRREGK